MEPHKILHSYIVGKFKNKVTNRRGKKGPFLNVKKTGIIRASWSCKFFFVKINIS